MQTSTDLRNLLARIDRKGYPAYKDTRGAYQFPAYVLSIDHVQGDPFAAPSKLSIHVNGKQHPFRLLPTSDFSLCRFANSPKPLRQIQR